MLPAEPYIYIQQEPHAGGSRPLSQGDVFLDVPLVQAARPDTRHAGQWKARVKVGPKALGMLVTHPCASRVRVSGALKSTLLLAPVVPCPSDFCEPWRGYYEFFPLPKLRAGENYVADLSSICPVATEHLVDRRIACLKEESLAVLFHRLALNASRLDRIPDHFAAEAQRLCFEMDLWERWATSLETEEGFQTWLDEPIADPPIEDEHGIQHLSSSVRASASTRREALRWHFEQINRELERYLAGS